MIIDVAEAWHSRLEVLDILLDQLLQHLLVLRPLHPRLCLRQLVQHGVLSNSPTQPRVEELAAPLPGHHTVNAALGKHPGRHIVQVCKLFRHLGVHRKQLLLPSLELRCDGGSLVVGCVGKAHVECGDDGIETGHSLEEVVVAILDLDDARRLKDASSRRSIDVTLHHVRVDGRVNNHPGAASELAIGGNVNEDGLLVVDEIVDNHGTKL
mmetsp:Transcript_38932/g.97476  ORF Transcript_38932/g.97476 Transcript_38932/m.97476 type:complete len:210 (-) Transcript_38932:2084-2713(-)